MPDSDTQPANFTWEPGDAEYVPPPLPPADGVEYPDDDDGFGALLTDCLSHQEVTSDIDVVIPFSEAPRFLGREIPGHGVVVRTVDGREYHLQWSLEATS